MELFLSTPSCFRLPIPPLLFPSLKHPQLPSSLSFPPIRPYFRRIPSPRAPTFPVRSPFIRACTRVRAADSGPFLSKISDFRDACWRFLRPHTIRGTALGSISLVTRALIDNSHLIKWSLLFKAFSGLFALICGNGYIVGINQIYDVGIDKVNKPYLPIAAGDLSIQNAWILVIFFAVTGLAITATNFGPFITSLYSLGLFLGTIYSVPPFRMKKYPVAAFLIIATVRGFLLNFGVYYATRAALGLAFEWSLPVVFITTFVTLFALVIAITKDLPDVEGDRKFQISTFATKLGVRNIAFLGTGILLLNYIGSILAAIYMPQAFRWSIMIPVHTILALSLIFQTWVLERGNYTKDAIGGFYRWIWNLFYAEDDGKEEALNVESLHEVLNNLSVRMDATVERFTAPFNDMSRQIEQRRDEVSPICRLVCELFAENPDFVPGFIRRTTLH